LTGVTLTPVDVSGSIAHSVAKNEWTSTVVRIAGLPAGSNGASLRISLSPDLGAGSISAYQMLSMPVDTNNAGYVRQMGKSEGTKDLPRALLPLKCENGMIDLSGLRDPAHPLDAQGKIGAGEEALVWIDLHVPSNAAPGDYSLQCSLGSAGVNGKLHVYDFALPQMRSLLMSSAVDWNRLQELYPDAFEAITPRLVNRSDPKYAEAIKILDALETLAEANRAQVVMPRLQPTVKWLAGERPQIDWSDFDSVISPWMTGDGFADKTGLGFWPVPTIDYLDNYDPGNKREYWSNAATHFNREDWLDRSAVNLPKYTSGRATALESIQLSMEARTVLESHPLVRVMLPLEDDQVQFVSPDNPLLLPLTVAGRIISLAPGLIFGAPTQSWPTDVRRPEHWMTAAGSGLVPYVGAGTNELDVRLWAWLAYLRHADLIDWGEALPEQDDPSALADPGKLTWFYPGSWFGVDEPVASVQLKWLRQAEQDYEYLMLAENRGMRANAFLLARLLTRQVELQPVQAPDPEYALLSGTVDRRTWDEAHELLARSILARPITAMANDPTVKAATDALDLDIIRWQSPKERPYILPRSAQWIWDDPNRSNGSNWAFVKLGVDIYNAGDARPQDNQLHWTSAGDAWEFKPDPQMIGSLRTYWVQRFSMNARVNLDRITARSRKPIEISFMDGYTGETYAAKAMLPVAPTVRREGDLRIDGKLGDWTDDDLIQDGPLVKMVDRPSIQRWTVDRASSPTRVFTGWSDDDFYVAFRGNGVSDKEQMRRNFVDYQFRRAWGEDLCQVLVQPVYDDNSVGPVTYLACKPNGVCMVKRRLDPRINSDPWRETDGTAVRYAADVQDGIWTGERAIPWKLLNNAATKRPRMLRFNFIQHWQRDGESASWAGPIDFDQDDGFTGLLYLETLTSPGLHP
jgi:hypothetical protein